MLESGSRIALVLVLAVLVAAPVQASSPVHEARGQATSRVQDVRDAVAENAPATGTEADALLRDVLDPRDDLSDTDDTRREAAQHAPRSGTVADDAVQAALDPEGDPQIRELRARLNDLLDQVRDRVPREPLDDIERQVAPVATIAGLSQQQGEAEPEPQAVTGEAERVQVTTPMILGASAVAAAAALAFLWLAGSSGSLGAAAGGAAASSGAGAASPLRRLLPLASPLFTRFEKDTVLGHPKREALYARILQDPGVSLQALCDATGLSRTAVTHHLRLLELQHLVVSKRVGRSRHYFENGGRYGRDQKDAYAVLHNDRTRDVARFVREHPGAIQKALCDALGIQPSIAHWHLRRLHEAQLVEPVRRGRTVAYFAGPALAAIESWPAAVARATAEPAVEPSVAPEPMLAAPVPMMARLAL